MQKQHKQEIADFTDLIYELEDRLTSFQDDKISEIEKDNFGIYIEEGVMTIVDDIVRYLNSKVDEFVEYIEEYDD